ncbi:hypothetical protein M9H77_09539 [Catharanthus roseus]|uniref:Uncharacterized protein n=1 Tax=Catharanthus roseus TaxID=4058 RepID=A0ACC0C0W3_CATRO|nr:hypothetical protein M9H77_09539 [Catharanthus roseus]
MNKSKESLLINSFGSNSEENYEENRGCNKCLRAFFHNLKELCNEIKDFAKKAVEMGKSDRRKPVFAIKMGLALSLISLLLFWEEKYNNVGQYAIWAILTVIVMFEFSIGATLIKGFNRGFGTFCAAMLAFFFAELSLLAGPRFEKVVIIFSFFITASFASYLRLYPTMAPYDYGYRVFVLTYCILMVAGNRSRNYILAILTRLVLIAFGALTCFIINISIYPIWSGEDLHRLVVKNFKDLSIALEGCVKEYLKGVDYQRIPSKIFTYQEASDDVPLYKGYRSVLESATREKTLLGFAIWEPPHGRYRMLNYPWTNFIRLSGALRHCAFMVMALHGCIMSEIQAPIEKRQVFHDHLQRVGTEGAKVLQEIASKLEKMEKLSNDDILKEVHEAAEKLQKLIDQRSYLLVNSESWEIEKQQKMPKEIEDLESTFFSQNSFDDLKMGFKSYSETIINMPRGTLRKEIPWPSPLPIDGEDGMIIKEDEIKTFESASSLSLATFASLLIEFVARLQNVVHTFQELSQKAQFT